MSREDTPIRTCGMNMNGSKENLFSKKKWYGKLLRWTLSSPALKTPLFRFVDVFPTLKTKQDILFFLNEYLGKHSDRSVPWLLKKSISFLYQRQKKSLPTKPYGLGGRTKPRFFDLSAFVSQQMREMSSLFIVGEDMDSAWPVLNQIRKEGFCFTLDLLGEAVLSEKEAQIYQNRYQQTMDQLNEKAKAWPPAPLMDEDEHGDPIPKSNISIKISSLDSQIQTVSWDVSKTRVKKKLRALFQKAKDRGTFINIDMEQYRYKDLTLSVFKELIAEEEFKNYPHYGIVIQAYLKDSLKDLKELLPFVKKRGTAITIRLTKGAYWDYEFIHSRQYNWPCPVYLNKKETDMNFSVCVDFILKAYPFLRLAVATHNIHSLVSVRHRSKEHNIPQRAIEIQTLYGMAGAMNKHLIKTGWRVRQYAPLGKAIPGMAYLVRRLLENTANDSFIRHPQMRESDIHKLLQAPIPSLTNPLKNQRGKFPLFRPHLTSSHWTLSQKSKNNEEPYKNTPLLDFSLSHHRHHFQKAIEEWKSQLPLSVPVVIDHKNQETRQTFKRENPSRPSQTVAVVSQADKVLCEKAVQSAKKSFASYSQIPAKQRCEMVQALADNILAHRYKLSTLQTLEVGKSWMEADADVCEAIDFCRYYALEMLRLSEPQLTAQVLGEESFYSYQPRGLALVIAPWNFPLAILTGMTVASLVTGNTVLIKPAEQSSAVAYQFMQLLIECGWPEGTVQFLPGKGEETGAFLVEHSETEIIAFTGSKETGTAILEKANQAFSRKNKLKRCIVEMGGKNAIIVDESADLDQAVAGVMESAFEFQGQKCSAASRILLARSIEKLWTERFLQAVQSLTIGPADHPESRLGPVVDTDALQKIQSYKEQGQKTACLISKEQTLPKEGYFISPAVFHQVPVDSPLLKEEIFGPVVTLIPFDDLDQAIDIANNTEFALTAGFYSRSPSRIKKAQQQLQAGNIYINRTCTGALVKRHPFGGFKMSGLGPKAGGPDYLLQFMNAKVVTENTVRRGFSPHLFDSSST